MEELVVKTHRKKLFTGLDDVDKLVSTVQDGHPSPGSIFKYSTNWEINTRTLYGK